MPEGDELQSHVMSGAEEGTQPREKSQKKTDHGPSLHDAVVGKAGSCKRLILRSNGILRTHRRLSSAPPAPFSLLVAFGQGRSWLSWIANSQWGYIAFASPGACLAIDKFYGFSTGWIRYIKTELALQGALIQLRYDWFTLLAKVENSQPTQDQIQLMLQKLEAFVVSVNTQVGQETDAWILEFQSGLAELANTLKSRAEAAKPGSLRVTVANAKDFDGGVKAVLDHGVDERSIEGTQCLFSAVAPGPHEVLARGLKGGKPYTATSVVQVSANSLASVTLPIAGLPP